MFCSCVGISYSESQENSAVNVVNIILGINESYCGEFHPRTYGDGDN